jgi:hypothetical protein
MHDVGRGVRRGARVVAAKSSDGGGATGRRVALCRRKAGN